VRHKKTFTTVAMITTVLLVSAGLSLAAPPAGNGLQGQAGKSNVSHCYLDPSEAEPGDGEGWGMVHFRDLGETVEYTINVKGLMPDHEYELRSGGKLAPPVTAVANGGGNVTFVGEITPDWGARFNIWNVTDGENTRILRTDDSTCELPANPEE
jgi:hypothetical protein